jgi:molecular chaperone HtpG
MPFPTKQIPFQVDIAGIIELMGTSLYSRADVPVRELIQNAHDGIIRRRQIDLKYQGRIDIVQNRERGTLQFLDDGIGLNADEAEKYLGTLGLGVTGLLKKKSFQAASTTGDGSMLIGQFGIGLLSSFMLAEQIVVESLRYDAAEAVRWEAGQGTQITLSMGNQSTPGTRVTLLLQPEYRFLAEDQEAVEKAVHEYADFLPVPIFLNRSTARVNVINAGWFEPTPDAESLELELEGYFQETPLDIIPVQISSPVPIRGALYVSPQRTPGFTDRPTVAVTVQRMVISRKIQDLLPDWASFLRGVLELPQASPTASREDLVRDECFRTVRGQLEHTLFNHFEALAEKDFRRLAALIAWHRYTLAGAALANERLRGLLRKTYRFLTSQGELTFRAILEKSASDPLYDPQWDRVIWYNPDRRQEQWMNSIFAGNAAPCVHTLKAFEDSLLCAMAADAADEGETIAIRVASPGVEGFAAGILGMHDLEEAPPEWQEFLAIGGAKVFSASFDPSLPVMAFLNERKELMKTIESLKKDGVIPAGFQRMIDAHFLDNLPQENEIILNQRHKLVARALSQSPRHLLAGVLRMLVMNAIISAGAAVDHDAHRRQAEDLEWIADAL